MRLFLAFFTVAAAGGLGAAPDAALAAGIIVFLLPFQRLFRLGAGLGRALSRLKPSPVRRAKAAPAAPADEGPLVIVDGHEDDAAVHGLLARTVVAHAALLQRRPRGIVVIVERRQAPVLERAERARIIRLPEPPSGDWLELLPALRDLVREALAPARTRSGQEAGTPFPGAAADRRPAPGSLPVGVVREAEETPAAGTTGFGDL